MSVMIEKIEVIGVDCQPLTLSRVTKSYEDGTPTQHFIRFNLDTDCVEVYVQEWIDTPDEMGLPVFKLSAEVKSHVGFLTRLMATPTFTDKPPF